MSLLFLEHVLGPESALVHIIASVELGSAIANAYRVPDAHTNCGHVRRLYDLEGCRQTLRQEETLIKKGTARAEFERNLQRAGARANADAHQSLFNIVVRKLAGLPTTQLQRQTDTALARVLHRKGLTVERNAGLLQPSVRTLRGIIAVARRTGRLPPRK